MTKREIIEIALAFSSLFIGVVAIWQSSKSIKLTEQSIRDANRPYIGINIDYVDTVYFEKFLVFKNYGNTSERITKLEILSEIHDDRLIRNRMQSLVGGVIMPGQKFSSTLTNDFNEDIVMKINYTGNDGEQYCEKFYIKTNMGSDLLWGSNKSSKDSDIATAIKLGSQAISKTLK